MTSIRETIGLLIFGLGLLIVVKIFQDYERDQEFWQKIGIKPYIPNRYIFNAGALLIVTGLCIIFAPQLPDLLKLILDN